MPAIKNCDGGANMRAFLDMIAVSELGYKLLSLSDNGYNVIVGSTPAKPILFNSYAAHPNKLIGPPIIAVKSTAAGRYQLLSRYYAPYTKQLGLKDFSPVSQDQIAIQQIRERRAIPMIASGDIPAAIKACSNIWASFPGAGYGQNEHNIQHLLNAYKQAGGVLKA